MSRPWYRLLFTSMTAFGREKIGSQKIFKKTFFQDTFYSLRSHTHSFTVLIYSATWRAAKLGIITHFRFENLPRCTQSLNSLIYVYSIHIPSCLLWVLDQSWSHFFVLPPRPLPRKKISVLPSDTIWTFWPHRNILVILNEISPTI